jgi:hypothetical protein
MRQISAAAAAVLIGCAEDVTDLMCEHLADLVRPLAVIAILYLETHPAGVGIGKPGMWELVKWPM